MSETRILDIGVATGYALLCVGLVSVMSPFGAGAASAQNLSQQRASSAIYQYVGTVGLVYLAGEPAETICSSLLQHSNSTVALGGEIAGLDCPGAPQSFVAESSLSFTISGRDEVIDAWIEGA